MVSLEFIAKLARPNTTKILLVVMDGLGGIPGGPKGLTGLDEAKTPNFDAIAPRATLGAIELVSPGITPGSGPGHLGLFGYDPIKYMIGRGVLSAAGLGLEMQAGDIAARINFCTVDQGGVVTDRRAGRIPTEAAVKLCEKLNAGIRIPGVTVTVKAEREHRAAVLFRGAGLDHGITDTDPQQEGKKPLDPEHANDTPAGRKTHGIVCDFIMQAGKILASEKPANMLLLRGFDAPPTLPEFREVFKLKAGAIAVYPMYRGLASLVGMDVIPVTGERVADEITALEGAWSTHDFVYLHVKKTDSYGEDGNRDAKIHVIEEVDGLLPRILALKPDCLLVTGDHSTPSVLKGHSWHPSPVLLLSPTGRPDGRARFTELNCDRGGLGRIHATDLMPLAMAHAMRLDKFGA
ncbi:MAG: 2,3-bisphosphoglycerate-independent phosphoglycerate mutase [Candidatus Coatesbacteria bacterium]